MDKIFITEQAKKSFQNDRDEIMKIYKDEGLDSARALADILAFGSAAIEWDKEPIDDRTMESARKIYKTAYLNGLEHEIENIELQTSLKNEARKAFERDIPAIKRFMKKPNFTVRLDNRSDRAFKQSLKRHSFSHEQEEAAHTIFHDCYHKLSHELSSHQ